MACALSAGYTQDCRDSVGGAKSIYFIESANVSAVTVAANVVTAITKLSAKRFWKYTPARETASAKSTLTASVQNGTVYFAQEVALALNKMQTSTRVELSNLAKNNLMAVVADQNGKYWLYGYRNGLDVTGGESGTGGAPGDRNGYQLTLTGNEPEDAIEVDSTTFGTLETPGS